VKGEIMNRNSFLFNIRISHFFVFTVIPLTALLTCVNLVKPDLGFAEPPTVVSTNPGNGATNVDLHIEKISITFSTEMDETAGYTLGGFPVIDGTAYWSDNGKTFNFPKNLHAPLRLGRTYTIILNPPGLHRPGFRDLSGNLVQEYTLSFSTKH
jgi:hypothetical protein